MISIIVAVLLCLCLLLNNSIVVEAQSTTTNNSDCNGPSITIKTASEVSKLAACTTYRGSVIIDRVGAGTIDLTGVQVITGNLSAQYVKGLTSITAPSLTNVGSGLDIENMANLSALSFPLLTSIGVGMNLTNLPKLESISGFPRLRTVSGSVQILASINSLPFGNLRNVTGNVNLTTSSTNNTICTLLTAAQRLSYIKGSVTCSLNATLPAIVDDSTDNSTAGNSGPRVGRIVGIVVGTIVGLLIATALVLWFAYFRPRRQQKKQAAHGKPETYPPTPEPTNPTPIVPSSNQGGNRVEPSAYYQNLGKQQHHPQDTTEVYRSEKADFPYQTPVHQQMHQPTQEASQMYSRSQPQFDPAMTAEEKEEAYARQQAEYDEKNNNRHSSNIQQQFTGKSETSDLYGAPPVAPLPSSAPPVPTTAPKRSYSWHQYQPNDHPSGLAQNPVFSRLAREDSQRQGGGPASASSVYSQEEADYPATAAAGYNRANRNSEPFTSSQPQSPQSPTSPTQHTIPRRPVPPQPPYPTHNDNNNNIPAIKRSTLKPGPTTALSAAAMAAIASEKRDRKEQNNPPSPVSPISSTYTHNYNHYEKSSNPTHPPIPPPVPPPRSPRRRAADGDVEMEMEKEVVAAVDENGENHGNGNNGRGRRSSDVPDILRPGGRISTLSKTDKRLVKEI